MTKYKDENNVSVYEVYNDENNLDVYKNGHFYDIFHNDKLLAEIDFQRGRIEQIGVNGVTNEALLSILIHRTKLLNKEKYCDENIDAIHHMEKALAYFEIRAENRKTKLVED